MENIYVTQPSIARYEDYIEEIKSIWETNHITNFGPKYLEFIRLLKKRFGYENIDVQCNGHMMLQNILSCVKKGEIITTPFTFVSTSLAIVNSGHTPVFCDISEEDYNIDVSRIEGMITENTVAIVPVHVFGSPCNVIEIEKIAKKYNVKVIYDAAHAFGVKVDGKEIGAFGDASMFSFHATKVFNSIEGGMGVFANSEMKEECICRSNFGICDGETIYNGVNSKMNEFAAAMGILNLQNLDQNIDRRKKITQAYDNAFNRIDDIKLIVRKNHVDYNYAYYPILIKTNSSYSAGELVQHLEKRNIYARRYFYPATNELDIFKGENSTPVAREVAEHIVCLPLSAQMSEDNVNRVISGVEEFFKQ